jgi:UDP-glucose 4-epimerase
MLVKLLVTGGAGFTGSVVTHRLAGAGHQAEVAGDRSAGFAVNIPDGNNFHQIPAHDIAVRNVAAVLTPQPGRQPVPDLTGIMAGARTFRSAAR